MTERQFTLESIGFVQKSREHTRLVLEKSFEPGLLGLKDFSHVWVFWWFDQNDTPEERATLQVHPRRNKNNPLTGVFATRSPVRPNLIALSLCRILSIKDHVVEIDTIDALAGTPVLDLKPYIPDNDLGEVSVPDWIHNPDDMNNQGFLKGKQE
jgi:tRNA-Thr(GGU) m(6)t(6)A37 methyltransferase TsaA